MGENYVLGNREDENSLFPYELDVRMFEENKVVMMGLGTQHSVALALGKDATEMPKLNIQEYVEASPSKNGRKKKQPVEESKKSE